MNIKPRHRVEINGQAVRQGQTWHRSLPHFSAQIRCIAIEPDKFVGVLRLGDAMIAETSEQPSWDQAGAALDALLIERLQAVFAA